ncbi:MAG: hypothetical protein GY856_34090, partial [bacterium]|nr:hypothetical protein [bacterium]
MRPWDVAVTPGGDLLYVTNRNTAMISVVDAVSYEVQAELTHQGQLGWVRDVAIPADAGNRTYVYVVGGDAQGRPSLFVLEVGDFNDATAFRDQILLPTPQFAETPTGMTVTADGETVYLTARYHGELWAVDVRPQKLGAIERIPLAAGVSGVTEAADDQLLYVTNTFSSEVYVLDLRSGGNRHRWLTTLAAGPCPQQIAVQPAVAAKKPLIAAVSPSSGAPDGGDPVTLLGANFAGGAAVFFGTQPATGVLVESELTIRAVTPPGTVG